MNQTNAMSKAVYFSLLLTCLFSIPTLVFAQQGTPYYTKALDGLNIREVEINTSGGSISVLHENIEKPRIEVYIKSNNGNNLSNSEIEKRLNERYELQIETSNNKIRATAKQKSSWTDWKNALSISFKVYVPEKVNTKLKTSGGSITLKGLDGTHDFATSGGSLNTEGVKGPLDGRTSGGSITVKNAEGKIALKTSGGSINAEASKGNIELKTSGGSIRLQDLAGTIDARTSGGSINGAGIDGELKTHTSGGSVNLSKLSGSVDASTSGGSMNVDIVQLGNYVKLRTSAGSINLSVPQGKGLDLDLGGTKVSAPTLTNFSGKASNSEISGTMQGGGIPISARTSGGNIKLSFN